MACNQNGQIVLRILKELNKPATLNQIVQHFVKITDINSPIIKTTVASVLQGGVRNGFIIKKGAKYYAADIDAEVAKGLGFEEKDEETNTQSEKDAANADDIQAGGEVNLVESIVQSREENQGKTSQQAIISKTRKSGQQKINYGKKKATKKHLTKRNIVKASKNHTDDSNDEEANDGLLLTENEMVENVALPGYESGDEDIKEKNLSKKRSALKKIKRNVTKKRSVQIKKRKSAKNTASPSTLAENLEGSSTNEAFMESDIVCTCKKCQKMEMEQQD